MQQWEKQQLYCPGNGMVGLLQYSFVGALLSCRGGWASTIYITCYVGVPLPRLGDGWASALNGLG